MSRAARGALRFAASCALVLAPLAGLAAPAAGTVIVNQATATAQVGGGATLSRSATVSLTVSGAPNARYSAVLAQNTQVESEPGATVLVPHTLTNTGDLADTYTVSIVDLANGGGWTYGSVALFPDRDGDGRPDGAAPLAGTHRLNPGETLHFVARLVVPPAVPLRTQNDARVWATSAGGAQITPNIDRVLLPDRSVPKDCAAVIKHISRESGPSPAGPVTITLTYQPCEKPRSRAVVTDRLPAGMTYIAGSGRWTDAAAAAAPLSDAQGVERENKGPSKIEYDFNGTVPGAVNIAVYNLPPNTGGIVSFDVEIAPGLKPGTVIPNSVSYTFYDERNQPFGHATSNVVSYTVTGLADFELLGDRVATAAPGTVVTFTNVLTNKGDSPDTYDIWLSGSTFPAGSEITLLKSDGVTPLADTDRSGTPDTGVVAPGASYRIVVKVRIPEFAVPAAYKVVKNARAASNPVRVVSADDVVDTILARCGTTLEPDQSAQIGYGQRVTYLHVLGNRGNCEETITAEAGYVSNDATAWTSDIYIDNRNGGGGSLPGAVDPTDNRVGQGWSRKLAPGESVRVLVDVRAPTEQAAAAAKLAKTTHANVTRLVLTASGSGALTVRDTTIAVGTAVNQQPGPPDNSIRNHTDPSYAAPTLRGIIGSFLYLRADAKICNADPGVAETRTVVITGANGDRELAIGTETGPNTGVFLVQPLPVRQPPVVPGNGTIEGQVDDVYDIEILGCNRRITTVVTLMESSSHVFDSVTNQPIAGAVIALGLASNGQCTSAALIHGGMPVGPFTTGTDGRYTLPQLPRGSYCLTVRPPNGYRFASQVPWPELPTGRNLLVSGLTSGGSYGGVFNAPGDAALTVDIPVDAAPQDGLFVQKVASRGMAELGDTVEYTVRVRNGTGNTLDRAPVMLADDLPAGFAYLAGTARRDGARIADPAGGSGPRLTLSLGTLRGNEQVSVSYRVRVGPGAMQGDGVNRVQASYTANGLTTLSNVATARVHVTGGVFSDKGFILGRIHLDCNANGVKDRDEPGVAGVRLVLEDGTYVITDGEGKYSFYGIPNRTHVLKVDRTTLPAGAKLVVTSARQLGDAGSRIVDLKAGELHRADFAIGECSEALRAAVKRRADAAAHGDEVAALAAAQLTTETRIVSDVKSLAASGIVQAAQAQALPGAAPQAGPGFNSVMPPTTPQRPSPAPELVGPPAPALVALEALLESLDNTLGFVGIGEGDRLATTQATIRVKGTAGATLRLRVNGEEVDEKRVGKRAVLQEKQVQAWEYFGIELKAGENQLEVTQVDPFGNPRGKAAVRVFAPGKPGRLAIGLPPGGAVADGKTAATVVVTLADEHGVPITARTPITLESSVGRWAAKDLNAEEPAFQAWIEGGRGEFPLLPPLEPAAAAIVVQGAGLRAEARLDFLPELRQMIAAGVIEGIVNLRKLKGNAIVPAGAGDGFEQELRRLSKEFGDNDESRAGARAAFYLKGKIRGEYLLTAAYDSDKDTRQRLFRDIQPDEFYPIYGDSGVRGFDAQSTSRLYVRIDNKRSYLLWGDFTTQSIAETRKLSSYNRSLTGLRHHYENDRVSANVFASRDSSRQVIEEIRANGTSGPYQLNSRGALVNSEKVEIVTRDRDQPALILSVVPQARFADYELEPMTGRILFRAPVPSVDRDLNPVFVRATYEVDQGGEQFWVAGIDAQVKLNSRVEVGGVYVKDRNPLVPFTLAGANLTVKLGAGTYVIAEAAHTEKGVDEVKGDAYRIELKHESKAIRGNAFVARSDATFDNPGAYLTQGRNEAGGKLEYKLSDRTTIRAEALRTEDAASHSVREGLAVSVQHRVADKLTLELGLRHGAEKGVASPVPPVQGPDGRALPTEPMPDEVTTVRARVTAPLPMVEGASVYGEVEVDVKDADRHVIAAGGEYQMGKKGRLYARHEFVSSITGPYGLNSNERQNTTAVGVDTEYMKDGRLFSEYRIRDALYGGDTEAALGLKNLWSIAPGLRLGTTFERVEALAGRGQNENTAVALALEYTGNPRWKGSTRLELRDGTSQDSLLFTVGLAAKLSRDWSALARNTFTLQRDADGLEHKVDRMQVGLAWRDNDTNKWNALARVESRFELNPLNAFVPEALVTSPAAITPPQPDKGVELKRTTHIVSLHADWQPVRPFLVTGRYAAKWATDKSGGLSSKYRMQAVGARATWEFAPRWDIGLATSILMGQGSESRQYAVGVEVGYLLMTNLWVSAGYNLSGYKDADLAGADHTAKGPYVRLRYKFDEAVLPGEARK